jgi:hypothetical protein
MPGVDRLAVDRGLTADGVEPRAVHEGRQQRVPGQRLVEPGDAADACANALARLRGFTCLQRHFRADGGR